MERAVGIGENTHNADRIIYKARIKRKEADRYLQSSYNVKTGRGLNGRLNGLGKGSGFGMQRQW